MIQQTQDMSRLLLRERQTELEEYIRILYESFENRPYCNEAEIDQLRTELDGYLTELDFRRQDRILSGINALCACFDYAGFSEGFRRGAELAVKMMKRI